MGRFSRCILCLFLLVSPLWAGQDNITDRPKVQVEGDIEYQRQIKDMEVGEKGYTVPWAYDPGNNYLNDRFSIHESPGGTVQMLVERTHDGYKITPPGDYKYDK